MTVGRVWPYLCRIFPRRVCHLLISIPAPPGCSASMSACQTMSCSCRHTGPAPTNSRKHHPPCLGLHYLGLLTGGWLSIKGASGRADVATESTAWEELFLVSPQETPYLCSDTSMAQLPDTTHTYSSPFSHLSELSEHCSCLYPMLVYFLHSILLWTCTSLEPWAAAMTPSSFTLTSTLPVLPEDETKGSWQ